MAVPQALVDLVQPWASLYGDNRVVSGVVMFAHLGGLLLGGGGAVAADRDTLRAVGAPPEERASHLIDLGRVHRVVLGGLGLTFVSGLLLLAADLETYGTSLLFWIKMGLVALLLANGAAMVRAERGVGIEAAAGWRRLHRTALISLVLWFAIIFVSTFLTSES